MGNPVEIQSGIQGIDLRIYESGIWVLLSAIILREGNVFGMKDLIALVLVSIGILIVNWAKPVGEKEKGMN